MEYIHVSTNVTFNAGISAKMVNIPILNNMMVADSTLFSVVLMSADPAVTLNPATTYISVLDDIDSTLKPPDVFNSICANTLLRWISFPLSVITIGLNPVTYSVREGAGNVTVTLSVLAGTLGRDVTAILTTMNSTAMRECRTTLKE